MTATLYEIGSQRKVVLFRWELDRQNDAVWTSRYRTLAGDLAAEDRVFWEGGRVARYEYVRPTIGERAQVERKDGKVFYTQFIDGRTRHASEADAPNYAVGSTLIPYVQSHWHDIVAGRRLVIRYGVPDQLRSFEFEAEQDRSRSSSKDSIVVRVRPASGFIRLFVDPVYVAFSPDGRELLALTGRVLPMDRRKGRLHPFDAEMIVDKITTGSGQ
jgi:hypothetical protein